MFCFFSFFQIHAVENQKFIVITGSCESTASEQRPEGYPTILRLDVQTGDAWVLIRLHQFPFSYFWEKVKNEKPKKES